ncbi:MAG: glycerate kinase [Desulfovibrio sp.]|jgi:glycerate kinase|nr:glycerate kinase [Desulfovibrio sp.]
MRIIVAPDSFKGSISASDAASAMEAGIRRVFPRADVVRAPVADGGEGTVRTIVAATKGQLRKAAVTGPLGRPLVAEWGILGDGATGVVEMAAASGLPLVPGRERNPCVTTTKGTGELVRAALEAGLKRLVLGIGGSATNDGGAGFARALGARFLDASGDEVPEGGIFLARLQRLDLSGMDDRLNNLEILVASDVDNPLCGPCGASAVFGPQKGADPEMVRRLDAALAHYAEIAEAATGRDVADMPGAGAAGGLGAGLLFFTNARLRPGVEIVLEAMNFDELARSADIVFTGEGNTDFQTACGKAPVGVALAAKRHGKPVVCVSGGLGKGWRDVLEKGIDGVMPCPDAPMSLQECMERGATLVSDAAERAARLVAAGMGLGGKY